MSACAVEACDRPGYGKQPWCEAHYRRVQRTGCPGDLPIGAGPPARDRCYVAGCDREATERGLCHAHYLRVIRLGDSKPDQPLLKRGRRRQADTVTGDRRRRTLPADQAMPTPRACSVEGCDRSARNRGLCKAHYKRLMLSGDVRAHVPLRTPPSAAGHITHGYRVIPVPLEDRFLTGGATSAFEHRLVVARQLGRALWPDESVHHRNGDRLDNRAENLELWSRWQPRGQRAEDKLRWALELVERYAPHRLAPEAR